MSRNGMPSHLDLCVSSPARSIPFYDTLLTTLGFQRSRGQERAWQDPGPTRAAWSIPLGPGVIFGIDLRPATVDATKPYDGNRPGPHHFALYADSRVMVDRVHCSLVAIDADIVDRPADYGGQTGYGTEYYAVFVCDPDGLKLEVVYAPGFEG